MTCKVCGKRAYSEYCVRHKPRKPLRYRGKQTLRYEEWRDNIAIPHLNMTTGRRCANCGATGKMDVDHIKNRGSHYHLRTVLSNVQYLCRKCHREKTDRVNRGEVDG